MDTTTTATMDTPYLIAAVTVAVIVSAVVLLGIIAAAAIAVHGLILRTTERLAQSGRLEQHVAAQVLTHLADRLDGIVRLVAEAVRACFMRRR